tara:strand:+ start:364 stop:576 length:213 start_codon:yes stop_codon:yes gene_type:complete
MKGTYYSAPMRKWEDGVPVGASSNPVITGGKAKRIKKIRTSKNKKRISKNKKRTKVHSRKYRRSRRTYKK